MSDAVQEARHKLERYLGQIVPALHENDYKPELNALLDAVRAEGAPPTGEAHPELDELARRAVLTLHSYFDNHFGCKCNCSACIAVGVLYGYHCVTALPDQRGEPSDPEEDAEHMALEVLCRVFDDGVDVAFEEWNDWYNPKEWFSPARALGAFIRKRLDQHGAGDPFAWAYRQKGTKTWAACCYNIQHNGDFEPGQWEFKPLYDVERGAGDPPLCQSGKDGDCTWERCPQLRDNEPERSGRHCPLDLWCDDCGESPWKCSCPKEVEHGEPTAAMVEAFWAELDQPPNHEVCIKPGSHDPRCIYKVDVPGLLRAALTTKRGAHG